MELKGISAVVSGGASGLGEATVRRLVGTGASCVVLDRNLEAGDRLAKELGERVSFVGGDVTSPDDVAGAVEEASRVAPLRLAVSCAGIGWAQRVVSKDGSPHDLEPFRSVMEVNLIGTFNVLRLAAARIASTEPTGDGERGVVVNTASIAAFEGQIGQIAYSASKGGIVGLTLPAARDLAPAGVRVVTIAPGLMDTPLLGLLPEEARGALGASVLFPKRLGRPADFASLVAHIGENPYLNGEVIRLDGGLRMQPK
jgi:NAD(P)-dependent dehydrogenase (short-subunit alcohol dehydrogenase family)